MNTNKSKWFDTIAIIFIVISFILITLFFSYCVAVTYDEYYYEYIERPNLIKKQQAEELNKKFETYKYIIDGREVNRDDIDTLVDNVNPDRLKNNPFKLDKDDIRKIYNNIFDEIERRK